MKRIIITIAFLTGLITVNAQQLKLDNSILWKVSGGKLTQPSYIMLTGTNCDDALVLPGKIQTALKNVSAIVVEYDLYASKDAGKLGSNNLAITDSQKMKANITTGEYMQYVNIFKSIGYPDAMIKEFANYKMNMTYSLLKMTAEPCGADHEPMAYEVQLKTQAQKSKLQYNVLQNIDQVIYETNTHTNSYWQQNISYHLKFEQIVKELLNAEADLYKSEKNY